MRHLSKYEALHLAEKDSLCYSLSGSLMEVQAVFVMKENFLQTTLCPLITPDIMKKISSTTTIIYIIKNSIML